MDAGGRTVQERRWDDKEIEYEVDWVLSVVDVPKARRVGRGRRESKRISNDPGDLVCPRRKGRATRTALRIAHAGKGLQFLQQPAEPDEK